MMDWQVLQDGLKSLVAWASGIVVYDIAWDGEPEAMRNYPMAMLELQRHAVDSSTDEVRYETDDDGRLVPYVVGNRVLTLKVSVKSRDQRAAFKASAIIESMRTRLELPQAQQMLDALEIALRESAVNVDQSAVSQNREESIAQLSLTLGYTVEERDEEHPEESIEKVEFSGEILNGADTITTPNSDAVALTFDGDDDQLTLG